MYECVEIIALRSAQEDELVKALTVCEHITPTVETVELMNVSVYRSNGYGSDISVHIQWVFDAPGPKKSLLGLQLAKSLGAFGIVSHTLWINHGISVAR
jgi:hypothetical protein